MWVHGFVMLLICTGTITLQQFWGFFEILVLYFLKYEFDKKKKKNTRHVLLICSKLYKLALQGSVHQNSECATESGLIWSIYISYAILLLISLGTRVLRILLHC